MGVFEHFPYTNFHDLNLDWIVQELEKLTTDVRDFISINAIKYANPIQWDITNQYEKNTVVLDKDGNAYLSVQPVPAGVSLDREEYWTNIGNFSALWESVKEAITIADEGHSTTASAPRAVNDLVWVDGKLLEVTKAIAAGDSYNTSAEGNCRVFTIQIMLDEMLAALSNETQARQDADSALQTSLGNETQAREDADSALQNRLNSSKVTNILDFGAVGDGETDDTTAIKNALADAKNNGCFLFIPKGKFLVKETLVIDFPITIKGISNGVGTTGYAEYSQEFASVLIADNSLAGNLLEIKTPLGCTIEDVQFYWNNTSYSARQESGSAIFISSSIIDGSHIHKNTMINRCAFIGFNVGVWENWCTLCTIQNSFFCLCRKTGILTLPENGNAETGGGWILNNQFIGDYITPVVMDSCIEIHNGYCWICNNLILGAKAGIRVYPTIYNCGYIEISQNSIEDQENTGIHFANNNGKTLSDVCVNSNEFSVLVDRGSFQDHIKVEDGNFINKLKIIDCTFNSGLTTANASFIHLNSGKHIEVKNCSLDNKSAGTDVYPIMVGGSVDTLAQFYDNNIQGFTKTPYYTTYCLVRDLLYPYTAATITGTVANGSIVYCSDGRSTSATDFTLTSGGSGAIAQRIGGTWYATTPYNA